MEIEGFVAELGVAAVPAERTDSYAMRLNERPASEGIEWTFDGRAIDQVASVPVEPHTVRVRLWMDGDQVRLRIGQWQD